MNIDKEREGKGRGRKEYINCDLTTAKRFLYSLQVEWVKDIQSWLTRISASVDLKEKRNQIRWLSYKLRR